MQLDKLTALPPRSQGSSLVRRLQVIASTAHEMPNELEQCLAVGMNFTATKPLQQAEFQNLVREAGRITREHREALGMGGA